MKRIISWFIICAIVLAICAIVGFMLIGAWWNSVILACICLLAYAINIEKD